MSAAFDVLWLREPAFWQGAFLLILIFGAAAADVMAGRIPNAVCAAAIIGGFCLSYLRGGLYGSEVSLANSALACIVAGGILLPFYLAKGLGAGDVKLMAGIGALAGQTVFVLWVLANTALAGMVLALAMLAWRGDAVMTFQRSVRALFTWSYTSPGDQNSTAGLRIPYALAICVGVLWTIWLFVDRQKNLPFF